MSNPLLDFNGLPPFSQIRPKHVEPAIDHILSENRQRIDELLASINTPTWENFVQPLADLNDRLSKVWSPVSHMNAVVNNDELRDAYNACLPKLSNYSTELGQNRQLYDAYKAIADSTAFTSLDQAQKKTIENALRDFHLSGVDLPVEKKQRFKVISQQLSSMTSKFSDNVLDATHGWNKHITDEILLNGLPDSAIAVAQQTAQQKELEGWLFTLDFPSYFAVITFADNRDLRQEMHDAFVTRASDQGPNAGQWDNSQLMEDILKLRHEKAQLLGYGNYAEMSLATKMADDTSRVIHFLTDLAERSRSMAQLELDEISAFAKQRDSLEPLQPWDIPYYSEKLRQQKYAISQEDLKPYLPAPQVVNGMFEVVKRLYGLHIEAVDGIDVWHSDARFYEIRDEGGTLRGQFYLDMYARPKKRGGAWMDECITRKRTGNEVQTPVAYLVCNFTPPVADQPALLTHNEVTTLFHEFGHGLHHMLTQVDYLPVSGINGVPWDAVELPSQFFENWCWEKEALDLIAHHYQSGEPLPDELFDKMIAAKNFQSGMQMVRQLEFALFDFRLHMEYNPQLGGRVQQILDEVRQQVAVVRPAPYNRFQHGFTHIFAGGYAAGYYSYKWAEVLSADAFSKFEESGIFNHDTGRQFMACILEQGGSRDPMDLFVEFRGREPSIDALLRHSGIAA